MRALEATERYGRGTDGWCDWEKRHAQDMPWLDMPEDDLLPKKQTVSG